MEYEICVNFIRCGCNIFPLICNVVFIFAASCVIPMNNFQQELSAHPFLYSQELAKLLREKAWLLLRVAGLPLVLQTACQMSTNDINLPYGTSLYLSYVLLSLELSWGNLHSIEKRSEWSFWFGFTNSTQEFNINVGRLSKYIGVADPNPGHDRSRKPVRCAPRPAKTQRTHQQNSKTQRKQNHVTDYSYWQ